jgi:hypothetical protein
MALLFELVRTTPELMDNAPVPVSPTVRPAVAPVPEDSTVAFGEVVLRITVSLEVGVAAPLQLPVVCQSVDVVPVQATLPARAGDELIAATSAVVPSKTAMWREKQDGCNIEIAF